MKKSISLIAAISLLPFGALASPTEDITPIIFESDAPLVSLMDTLSLTEQELTRGLEYFDRYDALPNAMIDIFDTSPLVNREFAVYRILESMGFHLTFEDIAHIDAQFDDVHIDSFFAPYIFFARDVGIVSGYEDGGFHPKQPMTHQEFRAVLTSIQEHSEALYKAYNVLRPEIHDETELTLHAAGE